MEGNDILVALFVEQDSFPAGKGVIVYLAAREGSTSARSGFNQPEISICPFVEYLDPIGVSVAEHDELIGC